MGQVLITREPDDLQVDEDVLASAVRNLESVRFKTDPLTVVLAGDLAAAAESRNHGAPVAVERVAGHVLGLVINGGGDDGIDPVILISAEHLAEASLGAEYVHLFAHEGWHVVQLEEGEDHGVLFGRLQDRDDDGYAYGHMAIEAVNEYRVELAITHSDARAEAARVDRIEEILGEIQTAFDECKGVPREARSNEWHQEVNDNLHDLFHFLGELAALEALHMQDADMSRLKQHDYWDSLVGDYWERFRGTLASAKPASSRMTGDEIDGIVNAVGTLIRTWMPELLGFTVTLEPEPDGGRATRHAVFDTVLIKPLG